MTSVVTLLLLFQNDEILLAMKKRGFGAGLWNGVGGKIGPGETTEQALVRECQEEIGVTPLEYDKVAEQIFKSTDDTIDIEMHTYICRSWTGEPAESEEMAPRWFKLSQIPYDKMWEDDLAWLPLVLHGKKLKASFDFDDAEHMTRAELTIVESL